MADEEVVVKLSLIDEMSSEIKAIRANMETNFGAANKKLAESKGAFASLGDEIKGSFVQAIKGAVLAYAGFEVINKVIGFMKSARMEYKESVQMQSQLRAALGYTSASLNEQAAALGRKLVVDNEEITAVQIKLANYVKNEEQVKKLTPAVLDLAAATGMDMASAANMVARGIADDSEELGRFKVKVDGAKGSAERIDSVIRGLNEQFRDQAVAIAESKDVFDNMEVSWKNFLEGTGKKVHDYYQALYDTGRMAAGTSLQRIQTENAMRFATTIENTSEKSKYLNALHQDRVKQLMEINRLSDLYTQKNKGKNLDLEKQKNDLKDQVALIMKGIEEVNKQNEAWNGSGATDKKEEKKKELTQMFPDRSTFDAQFVWQKEQEEKRVNEYVENNRKMETNRIATIKKVAAYEKWAADQKLKYDLMAAERQKQNAVNGMMMAGQLFSAIAGANKRNAQEKKNIARVEAFINTAVAITKALPNPVAVGFAAAMGIAQQVAIANAKFATGTAYQGGGMSLVGENGPEYVNLPRGASVYNNTQTRNMTTNASMNVTIMDSSGNITETLRTQIRSGQADYLVRDIQNRLARQI